MVKISYFGFSQQPDIFRPPELSECVLQINSFIKIIISLKTVHMIMKYENLVHFYGREPLVKSLGRPDLKVVLAKS